MKVMFKLIKKDYTNNDSSITNDDNTENDNN